MMDKKQILRTEFEKIRKREPLTPHSVVKEGTKKHSPLYPFFKDILENKKKVIQLALEQRARLLINYVSIEIISEQGVRNVPMYESIVIENNGEQMRQYEMIADISESNEYRMQVLETTSSWVQTMQQKLMRFKGFEPIVISFDKVKEAIIKIKDGK